MSVVVMEPLVVRARAPRRATPPVVEMDPLVVTARAPLTNRAAGALRDAAPGRVGFGGFAYSRTAQDDAEVASAVARASRRVPAPATDPAPGPDAEAPATANAAPDRAAFGGFAYTRTAEDDADVTRAAAAAEAATQDANAAPDASAGATPTAATASDPTTDAAGAVEAAALAPARGSPATAPVAPATVTAEAPTRGVAGPNPAAVDSPASLVAAVATAAGDLAHPTVPRAPLDRAFSPLTSAAAARAARPVPRGGGGRYPPPRPVEPIEIDPVPTATEALQTELNKRLPELTLPPITPMPDRVTIPTLPPVPQATPDELAVEVPLDDFARDAASVDSREATRRAEATRPAPDPATPAPAPRPVSPPVLIDFRTRPQPVPPAQADLETGQVARVLAIVMADLDNRARGLVDRARNLAFPPDKLANYFLDLTDPMVEPVTTGLRAKMNELAGAAHVSADALNAAVASRRAELDAHATHVATDAELEVSRTVVTLTRAQEREQARIETERLRNQARQVARLRSALHSRDPALVTELVTARMGYIDRDVGRAVAAAETAKARRLDLLGLYDTAYREAYRAADQAYQHPTGREARAPPNLGTRLWIDVARDNLTTAMAGLRTQTTTDATTLADGIRNAGVENKAAVRRWSDGRLRTTLTDEARTARAARDADDLTTAITNGRAEAAANAGRERLVGEIRFAVAAHLQAQDERDQVCRARAVTLDADSMAIGRAYLSAGSPGDPLSAVAESLVSRYAQENLATRPGEIRDAVHARPATDVMEARRKAQVYFPGGSAALDDRVTRLKRAFDVWHGTAEEDAINALSGGLDAHAMTLLNTHYQLRFNEDLQWRIRDEMSDSDRNMALGLASNDAAMHARGVIADSHGWFSNDPQRALDAVRNLPPGTADRVVNDADTRAHLTSVLGGSRWVHGRGSVTDDRGERELQLLVQLNSPVSATDPADIARRRDLQARADAIEFDRIVRAGSGGAPSLDTLMDRIRASVVAQPGTDAWSAAEVDDEVRRRVRAMENSYEGEFGAEFRSGTVSAMRYAVALNQRGTTYDLTNALIDVDRANERSTRIQRTSEGLYATDSEVNSELERGYRDALTEVRRNTTRRLEVEARMQQLMETDGVTANGRRPTARERAAYRLEAEEELARTIAAGWLADTTAAFATRYGRRWGGGANALTEMVTDVTQFGGEREAVDRLANGGALTAAQRVTHGVAGWGMERDPVIGALSGRTQQQLARIGAEYSAANDGENMVDRLRSETGDWTEATADTSLERDAFDLREALRGIPLTAREEHDAARRRFEYERDVYFGGATARPAAVSLEFDSLQAQFDLANEQWRDYESAVARGDAAAVRRIETGLAMANDAVAASADHYRRAVDDHVEGVAQKVAIGVALAVVAIAAIATSILTGGLAAPAWVGVATAVAASLAGTAASMAVRADMLGAAYGQNAFRNDLIVGAVDAIIAALTAGLGDKILRLPRLAGATPAARTLMARAIAAQRASRPLIARLGAFSAEQVVQGVPAAVTGAALNRDTWRGDPARAIAGAAGMGAVMSIGMAGVMHVGMAHAPRVFGGALDTVGFLRGRSGADVAADSVTLQSARRAVAAGNAEGASTQGSWLERWAARRAYLRANPDATSFDFDLALAEGRARAQADARAVADLQVEMRSHLLSGLSGQDADLARHARIEVLSDAEFFARTGSESNGYAATLNVRGEPVVVIREGAPLTRLREEGLHVAQFLDPANASRLALIDERRLADYAGLSLTGRIAAWNAKIDLELDVAARQLPDLRAQLADPSLHPDRVADLSRMLAEAEAAVETLSRRRQVLADLGPADLARMRQGDLAPPAFLADEPRLFAKKPPPTATSWTSGPFTFEPEADFMDGSRRSRFVVVREGTEIREVVLQRWRNGGWELSGKVGRERGGVAEVAARIEHALSNAAEESATVTMRQFNGQTGGGQGLDDVWFRFETQTDGTLVARARLYEAKNYADTQVTSYTAIDDNYAANVRRVRDRLQAHLNDGTWAEANMTRAQVEAAIAALDTRQVDIIVRTTSSTRVNPHDLVTIQGALNRGRKGSAIRVWHDPASIGAAAIEDAEELWLRTEAFRRRGAKDPDNVLFKELATGPRGMTPESIDIAEAVVTARAQPGSQITGRVEWAPTRTHLRDSNGPLRVIVAERPGSGAAFDATARARAILDATAAIPGATGIDAGPMRVVVDYSGLTIPQAKALRAALASVALAEGRGAEAARVVWTPPASFLP